MGVTAVGEWVALVAVFDGCGGQRGEGGGSRIGGPSRRLHG